MNFEHYRQLVAETAEKTLHEQGASITMTLCSLSGFHWTPREAPNSVDLNIDLDLDSSSKEALILTARIATAVDRHLRTAYGNAGVADANAFRFPEQNSIKLDLTLSVHFSKG